MKIRSFHSTTIRIDDPETGEIKDLRIQVTRFDIDQWSKWSKDFHRSGSPSSKSWVARNQSDEETLTDDKIRERRLAEMTDTQRAEFAAMEAAEEEFSKQFLIDSITQYVTVEDGQIEYEKADGTTEWVRSGAQMVKLYGAREDVLGALLGSVFAENRLSVALKKALRSRSDSARSSDAPKPEAVGPKPEPTATDAENAASVVTGDAQHPVMIPSGSAEAI